jgi:hypothetical protein
MRARQRHLNPKAAGAHTALDSRFEFSVATGTAISSWVSRTGSNNASQATGGNQPLYTTNAINGQPAILFDGSNDFMTISSTITSNAVSLIAVGHKTSVGGSTAVASRLTSLWNTSDNAQLVGDFATTKAWIPFYYYPSQWRSYRNSAEILALTLGYVPTVFGAVLDGTSVTGSLAGTSTTGTTSATALNANQIRFGAGTYTGSGSDGALNGYIGYMVYFLSVLTAPMRRRLERGAGYSFKIACS